jgi:hypothetical protein
MTDLLADMESYRDAINATGVRCVLDARDVNPPSVLIRPPRVMYRFGRGCTGASWAAWLFLPDSGQIDSLRLGFPILDKIHEGLATVGVAIVEATPTDFQPADGGIVPGFIITWTTTGR